MPNTGDAPSVLPPAFSAASRRRYSSSIAAVAVAPKAKPADDTGKAAKKPPKDLYVTYTPALSFLVMPKPTKH